MNYTPKRSATEQINATKERVKVVKPFLPHDWRKRIITKHPDLNDSKGIQFLGNLIRYQTYDEAITESLERIAVEYYQELRTGLVNIGLIKKPYK